MPDDAWLRMVRALAPPVTDAPIPRDDVPPGWAGVLADGDSKEASCG